MKLCEYVFAMAFHYRPMYAKLGFFGAIHGEDVKMF